MMADEVDPGQEAPQGQETANPWEGLPEDIGGYIETKGFRDVASLAESYKNLEGLRGVPEDRLLVLPKEGEDFSAIYDKLGRPESADAYENALGDGLNDGVFAAAAAKAHELGLSNDQFKGLQEVMGTQAQEIEQAQEQETLEKFTAWKADNEAGFQNAARMMAQVGIGEEQLAGILSGDKAGVYDFLAKVADKVAEGKPVDADPMQTPEYNMTQAGAKAKIAELQEDKEWIGDYLAGNKAKVARMTRLNQIAYGGKS